MNKTVHQSSNHCNWILSLALMNLFPHVLVIFLTLKTHVLFETRIGCDEVLTMMFQQIVFSFRETARVTRCHKQFSTTTFLLTSKITQLDRGPTGTLCSENQPRSFSLVCASWFPTPSERNKEDEEIPRCRMASVRHGASERQISTKSHRSTTAASRTD